MSPTRLTSTLVVDLADTPNPAAGADITQVTAEFVAQIERVFGDTPALQAQRRAALERDA